MFVPKPAPGALAAVLTASLTATAGVQQSPLPAIPNIAGKVLTVQGPVDPARLGQTLMHEHIFIDFQSPRPRPPAPNARPVSLANLAAVRMGGPSADNGFLADFDESLAEVMEFKFLASEGVDLSHVIMGQSNALVVDLPLARRVLARGVFIEFDYLGAPGSPGGYLGPRDDLKIAKGLVQLVKEGYGDRIVLGHDVCTKIQQKKYGGLGFTYISDYFLPALRTLGLTDQDIYKIMVENPRRALTFTAPQPQVRPSTATGRF